MLKNFSYKIGSQNSSPSAPKISRGKRSKYNIAVYAVKPVVSRRLISNNIQERLFKNKLHAYDMKKNLLLINCKELKKSYQKCVLLSKQLPSSVAKNLEDVEHVVINCLIKL